MKIATFNVNGINGRLSVLLRWLEEAQPAIVCLQELKAPDRRTSPSCCRIRFPVLPAKWQYGFPLRVGDVAGALEAVSQRAMHG
jgi:hypothetical protein